MKVQVDLEESTKVISSVEVDVAPDASVGVVASEAAPKLGIDVEEITADLYANGKRLGPGTLVSDYSAKGIPLRHRRDCVELHFESDIVTHHFPVSWTWGRVHLWACKRFDVPHDACANLELREGSSTGPALNEGAELGVFTGCKGVWLVKPGPEPNGGR